MISVRKAEERGRTDWDWLDSRHTFSFGDYFDPKNHGFGPLRVINDDRVAPGGGFDTHPHRDMEILSYVLDGALQHRDSTGGGGVIRPGEIQFMRAGRGVLHSEFNASKTEPVHFLQVWIIPAEKGLAPGYAQKPFDREAARTAPLLLASRDGRDGSIHVRQDADLWLLRPADGSRQELPLSGRRKAWVHVARGSAEVNGLAFSEGDGAALTAEESVAVTGTDDAEVLVFDLG
ncbi:MAG: pirin family protein [Acidobacteria bacterium]|nr:MAG: pirin family protein [Acidobacteriota bacterium]MCE7957286.1 pirin family protein [Acidobacteria bacterium ACB2]